MKRNLFLLVCSFLLVTGCVNSPANPLPLNNVFIPQQKQAESQPRLAVQEKVPTSVTIKKESVAETEQKQLQIPTGPSPVLPSSQPATEMISNTGSSSTSSGSSSSAVSAGGGSVGGGAPITQQTATPNPQPTQPPLGLRLITGVFVDGQNIMGPTAPGAIHANYAGKLIQLGIQGYFYLGAAQPNDVDVYLDNDITTETISVTNNRIEATFNTANIPDLYLVGNSHTLTVDLPDQTLKVEIRVGTPENNLSLSPQIQKIDVIRDEFGNAEYIEVQGFNMMKNLNFAQVKVDQEVVEILQNEFVNNTTVMQINLPENTALDKNTKHSFSYITPFGVSFQDFIAN